MAGLPQRIPPLAIAVLACLLLVSPGGACPFCGMQGPTLTGEVAQAKLVLYGQLTNAKEQANGDGTTDLVVETVIKNELAGKKDDPLAGNNKTVRLDRFLNPLDLTVQQPVLLLPSEVGGVADDQGRQIDPNVFILVRYLPRVEQPRFAEVGDHPVLCGRLHREYAMRCGPTVAGRFGQSSPVPWSPSA